MRRQAPARPGWSCTLPRRSRRHAGPASAERSHGCVQTREPAQRAGRAAEGAAVGASRPGPARKGGGGGQRWTAGLRGGEGAPPCGDGLRALMDVERGAHAMPGPVAVIQPDGPERHARQRVQRQPRRALREHRRVQRDVALRGPARARFTNGPSGGRLPAPLSCSGRSMRRRSVRRERGKALRGAVRRGLLPARLSGARGSARSPRARGRRGARQARRGTAGAPNSTHAAGLLMSDRKCKK